MTNIFTTSSKKPMKAYLFQIAVQALEDNGWKVERVQGSGKSSVRRISKGPQSKIVSIRTTQDTAIAFPRLEGDRGWRTLDDVDAVVPVSVDDRDNPKFAKVHLIDGDEMRDRFNRAYRARKDAGHSIPIGRGVWVPLYLPEAVDPPTHVGAGAGLKFRPIAIVPLSPDMISGKDDKEDDIDPSINIQKEESLTIVEAKRRLAKSLGIDPVNIKITIET